MATESIVVDAAGTRDSIEAVGFARPRRGLFHALAATPEWVFGTASLVVGLSILATIPVVQLLSLGYLLEAAGRVARSGRITAGFVGVRRAARVGQIVIGVCVLMLPLWIASSLRFSARLIDPTSARRGAGRSRCGC